MAQVSEQHSPFLDERREARAELLADLGIFIEEHESRSHHIAISTSDVKNWISEQEEKD